MHIENSMNFKYKTLVGPKVEHCMIVAQPVYKKHKEEIARVQRRATKLVQGMEINAYSETLEELKLPSLEYRRKQADDIIDEKKFLKPCMFYSTVIVIHSNKFTSCINSQIMLFKLRI